MVVLMVVLMKGYLNSSEWAVGLCSCWELLMLSYLYCLEGKEDTEPCLLDLLHWDTLTSEIIQHIQYKVYTIYIKEDFIYLIYLQ